MTQRTYVVGEIGPSFVSGPDRYVNEATLLRMIDAVADAGADCVKLQLKSHGAGCFYEGDDLERAPHDPKRAPFATRGEYVAHREPDYALLKYVDHECRARGIEWTASPWDLPGLALLMQFAPPWIKVASACLSNVTLLRAIRDTGVPVVLSTGMSTADEIAAAVAVLGRERLTLAVCTASYPATADTLHLARIGAMARRFGVPVGWSSHSPDPDHAALAVCHGATWVESHITTGKLRWGPDHLSSLDPQGFHEMVWKVREAERVSGSPDIGVLPCEEVARERLRRAS